MKKRRASLIYCDIYMSLDPANEETVQGNEEFIISPIDFLAPVGEPFLLKKNILASALNIACM